MWPISWSSTDARYPATKLNPSDVAVEGSTPALVTSELEVNQAISPATTSTDHWM